MKRQEAEKFDLYSETNMSEVSAFRRADTGDRQPRSQTQFAVWPGDKIATNLVGLSL